MKNFIQFSPKGIYCIPGKFYLDPWKPVDYAIISHGHADHARSGMKHYLCHHYTKPIIQHRIGKDISVESIGYNDPININGVNVSLHPAGHLIGSAQIRLEWKGYVFVFSGDYKVDEDEISTPFEPVKCHTFVTESTFGLPIYKWQKNNVYKEQLTNWVRRNQENNKTSVFFGYSLGKAQRIMKLIEGVDEIYVHSAIDNLNKAIESTGYEIPDYHRIDWDNRKQMDGKIVIVPPALLGSNMIKKVPYAATAICSGWMQIRGNRRWKSVDAGFPISDHADWDGLISAVKATQAEKVYVTHGSQATFAKYLNEIGIESFELKTEFGEEEKSATETIS